MKNTIRWGFFLAGIGILFLFLYYFILPLWPFHPAIGWGHYHFGPRVFPFFPFLTLAVMFAAGFLILNFLFRTKGSTVSKEEKRSFCPFCGSDLRQAEPIPEVSAEAVRSDKPKQRGKNESLSKIRRISNPFVPSGIRKEKSRYPSKTPLSMREMQWIFT